MLLIQTTCGELLKPLQTIAGVIDRKGVSSPVSSNVLIIVKNSSTEFVGSDSEIEIRVAGPKTADSLPPETELSFTVNHKILSDLIRASKSSEIVQFELDNDRMMVILRIGKGIYELRCTHGDEFPVIRCNADKICDFKARDCDLRLMIQQTQYMVPVTDARQYIRTVLLEIIDNAICIAGSDGCRLAYASGGLVEVNRYEPQTLNTLPNQDKDTYRMTFSKKSILELLKILVNSENPVYFEYFSNAMAKITVGGVNIVCKLVNCNYPNIRSVDPKGEDCAIFSIDRETVLESLKKVNSILSETPNKVINLKVSAGTMTVKASSKDNDKSSDSFDVSYQGEEFNYIFRLDYLFDTLHNITCEKVSLEFHFTPGSDRQRCKLKVLAPDMLQSYYALLMPFDVGSGQ